jgi:hypothetical protein
MTDQLNRMRRVAEIVTGQQYAIQGEPGHEEIFLAIPHDNEWEPDIWEPSLDKDSEDWQQAQALQVIVAAFKMPGFCECVRVDACGSLGDRFHISYIDKKLVQVRYTEDEPDLLSASISALLKE